MACLMARPIAAEVVETSRWVWAHEAVLGVARERAGLERREGICLLRARRDAVHRHLGYGAFAGYTDRHLGYNHRTTEDKLRTAEALEHLPELARAQQDGRLNASTVRELARVARADTESEWIEAAAGLRVREVERLVSGRAPGDRPTDAPRPDRVKHILRFEVSAETIAAFREAMRQAAERSGQRLADDDALLLIARGFLDAPVVAAPEADAGGSNTTGPFARGDTAQAGPARYQISISECPSCQRAFTPAGADLLEIGAATLAAARCDAQHIAPLREAQNDTNAIAADAGLNGAGGATHSVATDDTRGGCTAAEAAPSDGHTSDAHVGSRGTDSNEENEPPVATHASGAEAHSPRTTSAIPPALRRHVWQRDHHTCQIPGCRNHLDIEVHHIRPRAEAGPNCARNLICICSMHHRAIHAGQLHLSGSAGDLRVFHADGTPYGGRVSAARSDVSEKVFRGLRWLGYKERDARAAIAAALREPGASDIAQNDAALLRRALAHLG